MGRREREGHNGTVVMRERERSGRVRHMERDKEKKGERENEKK